MPSPAGHGQERAFVFLPQAPTLDPFIAIPGRERLVVLRTRGWERGRTGAYRRGPADPASRLCDPVSEPLDAVPVGELHNDSCVDRPPVTSVMKRIAVRGDDRATAANIGVICSA